MKEDISPKNSKGQLHGYQESYHSTGWLYRRCNRKNGFPVGYLEWHKRYSVPQTLFYIR